MSEFDEKLTEKVKNAVSEWEASYRRERLSPDITERILEAQRIRACPKEKKGMSYDFRRGLITFVADAQKRLRKEMQVAGSSERGHVPDTCISDPSSLVLPKNESQNARRVTLEQQRLVQRWRQALCEEDLKEGNAGICRPSKEFCERLALQSDEKLTKMATALRGAGIQVNLSDSMVSVTFPDGVQAFWCVCRKGDTIETRAAIDTSLWGSVFGSGQNGEIATRIRKELTLFFGDVAESLAWH